MVTGGVVAQSISVAAELGIADQLADGGKSSSQLAPLGGLLRSAGARMMLGRISAAFPHMTENVRTRKCAYSLIWKANCRRPD